MTLRATTMIPCLLDGTVWVVVVFAMFNSGSDSATRGRDEAPGYVVTRLLLVTIAPALALSVFGRGKKLRSRLRSPSWWHSRRCSSRQSLLFPESEPVRKTTSAHRWYDELLRLRGPVSPSLGRNLEGRRHTRGRDSIARQMCRFHSRLCTAVGPEPLILIRDRVCGTNRKGWSPSSVTEC